VAVNCVEQHHPGANYVCSSYFVSAGKLLWNLICGEYSYSMMFFAERWRPTSLFCCKQPRQCGCVYSFFAASSTIQFWICRAY
jgi:hypothetical protein